MTGPIDAALRTHIIEHFCKVVDATPLDADPFPHIFVNGILPADVYGRLERLLPSPENYEAFDYEKFQSQDGQSNRMRFQLTNACLDKLSGEARTLWYAVRSAVGSEELKSAVFDKLAPGLAFRYGVPASAAKDLPGFASPELFRETKGYTIKPHPDTRKKVVTMQISLAADDSQRDLGTEFYRRNFNPAAWLREPRGFDVVKRMAFVPNAAYAFVVLNAISLKSWHGKTAIPGALGVRNSLLNIWYAKPEHGHRDLVIEREQWAARCDRRQMAA